MLFKKKTETEIVAEDRKLIASNADAAGKLVMLCNGNEELATKLGELKEKLKYLIPVNTESAMDPDKKIGNKIADLKIELAHYDGHISQKIERLISDILLLTVSRKR